MQLLLDGEWFELRCCPLKATCRAAYEHVHRSRWLRFTRATNELIGPLTRESAFTSEASNPD